MTSPEGLSPVAADLQDERLRTSEGFGGLVRSVGERIRGGDLGVLPVIVGLLVIWTVFQSLNSSFLSSANLGNLLMESAAVGVIALGIVCVLLVGEIDLSVGSVSGLSAAILGVSFVQNDWPVWVAVLGSLAAGAAIGFVYSIVYTRFGVPSFVISLAGLLGFLGLQLKVLGPSGTINLPFDSPIVKLGQLWFVPATLSYVLVVLAAAGFFLARFGRSRARAKAGLSSVPVLHLALQAGAMAVVLLAAAWYMNQARGIGWMFVLFVGLVLALHYALTRTRWGRSVFAVGGNEEAARRAGVNVNRVYTSVFMLCSMLAALGGILAAGRLAAAAQSSGTGDVNLNAIAAAVIGGTSLFGGRGSAFAALLGILVISSISSGLTLVNLDSSWRFMVTGGVLLLAVILDSVARRSRVSHGRA
ncbi:sugar ABC transporter permease [Aeromicrobium duanguangcaii]|uniref:Xylose transport system permease protein XylH n=1 Tax=Aeromicrobium duanguangcaii TaxID=2968086 RepID=A0ABY5KHL7_9ACTN|nr:sugar ABC transporter permease [Aeromicrobium duanguangcaii]MCD9154393.1 sugar ABC transporter permease [Aeromicrobium duanguangcaii]UUI68541.1 sugar ABC transporter permease [Aeromicrobium duanguangcaii]